MALTWDDSYSVGVTKFDNQHKKLVKMLNSLESAMAEGKARDILREILIELIDYVKQHFKDEEEMMTKHNYGDYTLHKAEHDKLKRDVIDFVKRFNAGEKGVAVQLLPFLERWLINHIKGTDKKYQPFMNKYGMR